MKTITEHIREHLLKQCGVSEKFPDLESLRKTEWSPRFEQLMRNRLVIGAFRYGLLNTPNKPVWDRLGSVRRKLVLYEKTGNDELLVDMANMMLLEFEEGQHPLKHFAFTDDVNHAVQKNNLQNITSKV